MAAPLTRFGGMQVFSDSDIAAGASWRSTIQKSLDKATVAVLLVSRHFLKSTFIMDVELPYILKARATPRGLVVLWVLVSECLYEQTPLQSIRAALPTATPLEAMTDSKRSTALKTLCRRIHDSSLAAETPMLDPALSGRKIPQKVQDLKLLARPATRRVEVFIRADNGDWYHQGPVLPGQYGRSCWFGNDKTKAGTGFRIMAMTTDVPVPHQHGKPTNPLPKARTRSHELHITRL